MALAALSFLTLAVLMTFNVGQLSTAKTKTMNTADAAAYTAAVTLARDMNFMAYTNRAIVANHVTVGQIVSFVSYTQMLGNTSRNISYVAQFIPYAGAAIAQALRTIDQISDQLPPVANAAITAINGVIIGLSYAQDGVTVASMVDAQSNVRTVIAQSGPNLSWLGEPEAVASAAQFLNYKQRKSSRNDKLRERTVVLDSRDDFTRSRESLFGFTEGGTDFIDTTTWLGLDAANPCVGLGPFCFDVPLGAGGALSGSGRSDWIQDTDKRPNYGALGSASPWSFEQGWAFSEKKTLSTYNGLQQYYDTRDRTKDASPPIVVGVEMTINGNGAGSTRTSRVVFGQTQANNRYALNEPKQKVLSVSAAEVYFKRPLWGQSSNSINRRLANALYKPRGEYASLFSPYWQARLTDVPAVMQATMQARY